MRVHVFQHVPFEGLGSLAPWLAARGAGVSLTRFDDEPCPQPPPPDAFDALIVLGGPMSVNDEARLPWLREEKRRVAEAVTGGKAVLGVCLGAQLIAAALGARVFPNAQREIGWFPVFGEAGGGPLAFPRESLAFHWHGETFDLPPGAVRLARSAACANQAFRIGRRVAGLQFHLETTPAGVAALVEHCRDELLPGPSVQGEVALLAAGADCYAAANARMAALLDELTDGLA
ncbi:MAG: type 1 glutamine amidotransferase [Verrucomicrobiota bacterium]|jgi:GMP synthase-like glutamine amidotransferase|nr:type 1 glutamine amidotransferase [Verrucomicrobiota bacterium]